MKKLLMSTLVLALLCGCGGSSSKTSKTCTIEQDGVTVAMTATSTDGTKIDGLEAKSSLSIDDAIAAGYGESKEDIESGLETLNAMMDTMEQEGFTIDMLIDGDNFVTSMKFDFTKFTEEQLTELGIDLGDMTSIDAFVQSATEAGGTCK